MRALTIDAAREIAEQKGGKCLSTKYKDNRTKLRWRCGEGHEWWAPLSGIRHSSRWCPKCARDKAGSTQRLTIEDMHKLAATREGKCLSTIYVNANSRLKWSCKNGHEWLAVPGSVRAGRWCKRCSASKRGIERRKGIEFYQALAKERGGRCLSEEYRGANIPLFWQCALGHGWSAIPDSVRRGSWCKKCANESRRNSQKAKIQDLTDLARARSGDFLSKIYDGSQVKHLWVCKLGHQWEAAPYTVKKGSWCPTCAGSNPLTIEDARAIADNKGGKCLSVELGRSDSKLSWVCKNGHQWNATFYSVRGGSWCPDCAGVKKLSIAIARKAAERRGGTCLSNAYTNVDSPLLWSCAEGHEWSASLASIKNGSWCRDCQGRARPTIEAIRTLAAERGGMCTSTHYIEAKTPLQWKCSFGHEWSAILGSIRRGTWCPECQIGVGERIVRQYFEQIFKTRFPSVRPKWLKNPKTGLPLELDGYSERLRIAFEHQGAQHYHTRTPFIKTQEDLDERTALDLLKKRICKKEGVTLIEIPSVPDMVPLKGLATFLHVALKENNISIPSSADLNSIDLKKAYAPDTKEMLNGLRDLASSRQGVCLSKLFLGSTRKHEWQCIEGHQWQATPVKIRSGRWCPKCAGKQPRTIAEMKKYAESMGGKCLSAAYLGNRTKLHWECKRGHKWWALPQSEKRKVWCGECYHEERKYRAPNRTIQDLDRLARERGGECLSRSYWRSNDILNWKCKEGHKWKASATSIVQGSWCPECGITRRSKAQRLDIKRLHEAATKFDGKLIGGNYENSSTKMQWECRFSHIWEATAGSILSGTWCPECATAQRANSQRTPIEEIKVLAKSRGGYCHSGSYKHPTEKLAWECSAGHTWSAKWAPVKAGGWCPECAKKKMGAYRKLSLKSLQEAARKRGGNCRSLQYLGSQEPHEWECARGHIWKAIATSVVTGHSWCPDCAPNKKRTIQDMMARAAARGGKCVSLEYKNAHSPLEWECSAGHRWHATPDKIQRGYWCKKCI